MATISFEVSNESLARIKPAMKGLYGRDNPMIPDPDWVDDGTEAPQVPKFTDTQWAKEALRRIVIRDVKRWETKIAQENAEADADDNLLT